MALADIRLARRDILASGLAGTAALGAADVNARQPADPARRAEDDLAWMPAWQVRQLFLSKRLSPLEYAKALIERIERNRGLGAFISVFPELLLEQAKRAEATMGPDAPLLHGLPVSLKDCLFTKGQRTTYGSRLFEQYVPDVDSIPSERVKAAGGIIFAKSNLPEFALHSRSINLVSREAVNPWDQSRTSGGSSGGAAAATAAGLGPLAIGTDGGGSIRLPSAFNGVVGLMPSQGRVPAGAGIYSNPFSRIGPITRDVKDAAMLLQVIAGHDRRDAFASRTPVPNYLAEIEKGVKGLRMVWSSDFGRIAPHDPEVVATALETARAFKTLGARYSEEPIRLEDPFDPYEPNHEYSVDVATARMKAIVPDYVDVGAWLSLLPNDKRHMLTGYVRSTFDPDEYAMRITPAVRYSQKTRLDDLFQRIDLLLCPTISRIAYVAGGDTPTQFEYIEYTCLFNFSGYCAASVPAGFHQGMPVGLQIVGRPGQEDLILRAARALERERPWNERYPPFQGIA